MFKSDWPWGLILLAFLARIPCLGRSSLWQDEIGFLKIAGIPISFSAFLSNLWDVIVWAAQQPLSFIVWRLYIKIAELCVHDVIHNQFILRLLAVFFGIMALVFINRLVRRLFDENTALLCGLFMAFLFFPVYYSREVYCYPMVLFLAAYSLYEFYRLVFEARSKTGPFIGACVGFAALAHTHLGGLPVLVATSLVTFILWGSLVWKRKDGMLAKNLFVGGLALGIALVSAMPFFLRFLLNNKGHKTGSPHSIPIILNDAISKMFMGERIGFAALAWTLFAAGIACLIFSRERSAEKRFFAGITLLATLLLAVATHRSQYLSVRYFSPVAPLIIMTFGIGLRTVSGAVARLFKGARGDVIAWCGAALMLAYSTIMYIVPMYSLKNKEPWDDHLVAQWLNDNLSPGTPYVMFSGYRLRWVPGFYPTPDLVAACPYIQGSGPEEIRRLDERQQDFARRFPVSVYVGATHTPSDIPAGDWPWPRDFYKQHLEIGDPGALQTLIDRGIFIGEPYQRLRRNDWAIDMFFNTREDAIAIARERGDDIYFDFDGWSCEMIATHPRGVWAEYAWGRAGAKTSVKIINLRDTPVSGRVVMHCAAVGLQDGRYDLRYVLNDRMCGGGEMLSGILRDVASEPMTLDPDVWYELIMDARSPGIDSLRVMLVYKAAFVPVNNAHNKAD